jgi:hypothetical protein
MIIDQMGQTMVAEILDQLIGAQSMLAQEEEQAESPRPNSQLLKPSSIAL